MLGWLVDPPSQVIRPVLWTTLYYCISALKRLNGKSFRFFLKIARVCTHHFLHSHRRPYAGHLLRACVIRSVSTPDAKLFLSCNNTRTEREGEKTGAILTNSGVVKKLFWCQDSLVIQGVILVRLYSSCPWLSNYTNVEQGPDKDSGKKMIPDIVDSGYCAYLNCWSTWPRRNP